MATAQIFQSWGIYPNALQNRSCSRCCLTICNATDAPTYALLIFQNNFVFVRSRNWTNWIESGPHQDPILFFILLPAAGSTVCKNANGICHSTVVWPSFRDCFREQEDQSGQPLSTKTKILYPESIAKYPKDPTIDQFEVLHSLRTILQSLSKSCKKVSRASWTAFIVW